MKLLVTGSGGFVGLPLVQALRADGHEVRRLVRDPARCRAGEAYLWDPERGEIDPSAFTGVEGVIHLAGENIASGRWTEARLSRIRLSRVRGTRLLAEGIARLPSPPRVFVSASATGFYGDRGEAWVDEASPAGTGLLAGICVEWEEATRAASEAGVRCVLPRLGVVLSPAGGALGRMLPMFRLGLGGPLGTGRQYLSWVALADLVGILRHCLVTPQLHGPVNAVSPSPVPQRDFARALGARLHRPAWIPAPAPLLRLVLGRMADELLLSGARVRPTRLLESGYAFLAPGLEAGLAGV